MIKSETQDWYEKFYEQRKQEATPWYRCMFELARTRTLAPPLLELGCGKGWLLGSFIANGLFDVSDVFGIEQSQSAIDQVRETLPNVRQGNIQNGLPFEDNSVGTVVLAEVIEHLTDPWGVVREIHRVLKPGGKFVMSFPNYANLPWLAWRILAEKLNKPDMIVLQPVDHIFYMPSLARRIGALGFAMVRSVGTVYFPPIGWTKEPGAFTALMNRLGLQWLSFHPVIVFEKKA